MAFWGQPKKRAADVDPEAPTPAKRTALAPAPAAVSVRSAALADALRIRARQHRASTRINTAFRVFLAVPCVLYPACARAGHPQFSVSCVIVCVISAQVIDLTHAQPPASSVPAAQPKAAQAAAGGAPPLQLKQAPPAAAKKKGPAASGKQGPKEPLAGGGKERFKSVKQVSVPGAEYFDQSIGWAVLRDGRELLLGCEVWHVPAGFAHHPKTHAPTQVGKMPLSFAEWQEQFGLSRSLFDYIDENRDGEVSWQEFTSVNRVRNQLNALKAKEEALEEALDQYKPDEHAPECIAEGGQGMILVGKDLSTGDKVAIKVERVLKVRALKRESARERESERERESKRARERERE